MDQQFFDPITLFVIIGGLGLIFGCAILRQIEATQRQLPVWISTGLLGLLVIGGSSLVSIYGRGVDQSRKVAAGNPSPDSKAKPNVAAPDGSSGRVAPGTGPVSIGSAGPVSPGGMAGGPPGQAPGGGSPPATRELTQLIGKLELLIKGVRITIDGENADKLIALLAKLDTESEMTETAARTQIDAITALLSSENRSALDSIELPRRRPARSGGGPGGAGLVGGGVGGGGGGAGSGGRGEGRGDGQPGAGRADPESGDLRGPRPATTVSTSPVASTSVIAPSGGRGGGESTENPFKQEENAQRLQRLRARLAESTDVGRPNPGPNE